MGKKANAVASHRRIRRRRTKKEQKISYLHIFCSSHERANACKKRVSCGAPTTEIRKWRRSPSGFNTHTPVFRFYLLLKLSSLFLTLARSGGWVGWEVVEKRGITIAPSSCHHQQQQRQQRQQQHRPPLARSACVILSSGVGQFHANKTPLNEC